MAATLKDGRECKEVETSMRSMWGSLLFGVKTWVGGVGKVRWLSKGMFVLATGQFFFFGTAKSCCVTHPQPRPLCSVASCAQTSQDVDE